MVLTVATVPLAFSTWTFDVFNLTSLTVLWVGVAVAWTMEAWLGFPSLRQPTRVMVLPVAAYVGVLVLATLASRAPMVSLLGNYGRFGGLVTTVAVVALAHLLAHRLGEARARHSQMAGALVVSAALGAVYLWFQEGGVDAFSWLEPWREAPRHPPGALGNSNFSGAHLAMATPAALWLAHGTRGRGRALWIAAAVLCTSGVAVSQSRGAMLALAAGLMVGAVAWRLPWRPIVGAGAAIMVLVAGFALATNDRGADELLASTTWGERVDLWQVALDGFPDHPILGGGPDLYRLTFADHAGPELADVVSDEPHNVLLDHLDGAGVAGAAAWLVVVVAAVRVGLAASRRRVAALWFTVGAVYLTQAMVSIDVVGLQTWGWVAVAGLAGTARLNHRVGEARFVHPTRAGLILVAGAALVIVALGPFRADMAHRRGIEASNTGDDATAIAELRDAVDRHGWESRFHRRLGIQLAITGRASGDPNLLAEAEAELERALDLFPDDLVARQWLATLTDP